MPWTRTRRRRIQAALRLMWLFLVMVAAEGEVRKRWAALRELRRDGTDAWRAAWRADLARRDSVMEGIPELKHPGDISLEKLIPVDRGRSNWPVDRDRPVPLEGR
ncbi:hypothetical protein [Verrucomicrobium sp. 3C]|uniref:hypothetical protein n=1 Tax=Verrucomicrobium sp. 3C TaxID=1134055 RepID=UPI0003818D7D|nr:hypothetical protein [Verrucomicrobium sp. 3C]